MTFITCDVVVSLVTNVCIACSVIGVGRNKQRKFISKGYTCLFLSTFGDVRNPKSAAWLSGWLPHGRLTVSDDSDLCCR